MLSEAKGAYVFMSLASAASVNAFVSCHAPINPALHVTKIQTGRQCDSPKFHL